MAAEVVLDLITAAMEHCTVLGQGESPAPEDATYAFGRLNNLIDGWNADEWMLYQRPETSGVLTNGLAGPYTLGPSGTFSTVRPVLILAALISPAGTSLTLDMDLLTWEEYTDIEDRATTSVRPTKLYCDYAFPNSNIYVWGTPSGAPTLRLTSLVQLSQFVTLQDPVSLPPAYAEALEFDLAFTLAAGFGKQLPDSVVKKAVDAKTRVRQANQRALATFRKAVSEGLVPASSLPANVQPQQPPPAQQ